MLVKPKRVDTDPMLAAFCKAVQERREELGLSQEELAARAGLHRTYISDIERGSRNLSLKSLSRLAAALDTPVSALIHTAEVKVSTGDYLHLRRSYVREGSGKLRREQMAQQQQEAGDHGTNGSHTADNCPVCGSEIKKD
jgi:transcriptional regulator with XRE-family HTH domain